MFKILFRESSYYLIGNIFTQIVGLITVVAAMRTLPIAEFGVYSYALAFVTFFSFIADGGLSQYLIKEIVQNEDRAMAIYRNVQGLQMILSLVILMVLSIIAMVIHEPYEFSIVIILGLSAVINGYISPIFSSLIAQGQRKIILKKDLTIALVRLAYLFAFIIFDQSLLFFVGNNLVCALSTMAYCFIIKKDKEFSYFFQHQIDYRRFGKILVDGLPYSSLMLANILYNKIDVIMLKYIVGEIEVAIYSGATQFIYPFMFVSTVLSNSIFPHLSRNAGNDLAFTKVRNNGAIIMAGVGFLMSASLFMTSDLLFDTLFNGKYAQSLQIYNVLVWYLFVVFSYGAFSNAIVASGGVKLILKLTATMLVLNVGLNCILIEKYGAVGAAIATLICELIILISVVMFSLRSNFADRRISI